MLQRSVGESQPVATPLKIPGYHWDEEKKRYYKIDNTSRDAHWSHESIKRRKKQKSQAEHEKRRALSLTRKPPCIRRCKQLTHPLLGGFLAREVFGPESAGTASFGFQRFSISGLETPSFWIQSLPAGKHTDLGPSHRQHESCHQTYNVDSGRTQSLQNCRDRFVTDYTGIPNATLAAAGMSNGGRLPALDSDFQNASLATMYDLKGSFDMQPDRAVTHETGNMSCFWVSGLEHRLGMGMVYATIDRTTIRSAYLPFNDSGRIDPKCDRRPQRMRERRLYEEQCRTPGISSIKYHEPLNRVIVTSESQDTSCSIYLFNPVQNPPDEAGPSWLLGQTDVYQRISMQADSHLLWWTNTNAIAPSSSSLVCAMGTNTGLVTFGRNEKLSSIIPNSLSPGEILGLDFLPGHRNEVLIAGGRRGKVLLADLRIPPERFEYSAVVHSDVDWHGMHRTGFDLNERRTVRGARYKKFRRNRYSCNGKGSGGHISDSWNHTEKGLSISHVVGMNENQILVSGIKNKMCIYDIRWRKPSLSISPIGERHSWTAVGQTTAPLVTFPDFHNEMTLYHGLAVSNASSSAASGAGQVVAAAHDDGSVALYSARTGRRIACPAVDTLVLRGSHGRKTGAPVQCLQWQWMPGERHESLWAGVGTEVMGVGLTWDDDEEAGSG